MLLAWILAGTSSFLDLGLGRATTTLVARIPNSEPRRLALVVWASLVLMTSVGAVISLVLIGLAPVAAGGGWLSIPSSLVDEAVSAIRVLALAIPLVTASACLRGVLEARQRFDLVNFVRAPAGVLTYVGPTIMVLFSATLPAAMVGLVAARVVTVAAFALASRVVIPTWHSNQLDTKNMVEIARFGAWLTVSGVAGPAVAQLDKFVIGSLLSIAAVSYYVTPYEVATKVWALPGAMAAVLFAAFAATNLEGNIQQARQLFERGYRYLLVSVFAVTVAIVAVGPWALGVWLGRDFATHSGLVLQILALGVFANSLAYVPTVFIQGSGRPDLTAKLYFAELIPYFILLWIGIRSGGVEGAAVVWTLRCVADAIALFGFAGVRLKWTALEVRGFALGTTLAVAYLIAAVVLRNALGQLIYWALLVITSPLVVGTVLLLAYRDDHPEQVDLTDGYASPACPVCSSPSEPFMGGLKDRVYGAPGVWKLVRCNAKSCGLTWLWPMPSVSERAEFYASYYTHETGAASPRTRPALFSEMERLRLARLGYPVVAASDRGWLRALSRLHPGGDAELDATVLYLKAPAGGNRVLDLGCGSGDLMARLRGLGWDPVGVDTDPEAVATATGHGLDARTGTLSDQVFPAGHFDAIVSSHVIEHLDQPVELLQECQRILKPGGVLVFVTPNLNSLCRHLFGQAWSSLDPPRHVMLHTERSLRRAASQAGLQIVSCGSTARYARSVLNLSIRLLMRGQLGGHEAVGWLGQLLALPIQFLERSLIVAGVDWGEELRLIARNGETTTSPGAERVPTQAPVGVARDL
jgi:O-antigen/teichoic acid export membrane protein/2-polyprenyl-3-methyl-5-hydroxy-6-metoxy-1,4-benzoquinol methylase